MDGTITVETKINTTSNDVLTVKEFLAEGDESELYKVTYQGEEKALKWYKKSFLYSNKDIQAFYENLKTNINNGKPSNEFLWPIALTEFDGDTFGYIMDIIPSEYRTLSEFMIGRVNFNSYRKRIDTCLYIVNAFKNLHDKGLNYQDLDACEFWINPEKIKILISECDKIAQSDKEIGILGKPRYLAPEVVLGKAKPNNQTDRFSMAIILYIILCYNHPLEGKRSLESAISADLISKSYGSEAYFMMDPDPNNPNKPSETIHKNSIAIWNRLPNYVKEIFLKVFSQDSIKNQIDRPLEIDWLKILTRFRSDIVNCSCGNEVFTKNVESCKCENCNNTIQIPFKLCLSDYAIPVTKTSRIYKCQLNNTDNALAPVASVVPTKDTGKLHIWNKTKDTWDAKTPSGKSKTVAPESKIPLKSGIIFTVNGQEIKIEANKN